MSQPQFPPKRAIAAIGDSHALYSFGYCRQVDVYWLGPRLMHRVARDGLRSLITNEELGFYGETYLSDHLAILLSFGEIDARSHMPGIAEKSGWTLEEAALDLVERFMTRMEEQALFDWTKIIIPGIVPPSGLFPGEEEIAAQVIIRGVINERLARHGARLGYRYMPPPPILTGPNGALAGKFDLDGVHVNYDGAVLMTERMCAIDGVSPSFESREIDILQQTVTNRFGLG